VAVQEGDHVSQAEARPPRLGQQGIDAPGQDLQPLAPPQGRAGGPKEEGCQDRPRVKPPGVAS
jgi:hypothetical protein